ncbi:MAG: hypothetical protein WC389_13025 [Lutibacter sp.]|jgi:hypothetical protein
MALKMVKRKENTPQGGDTKHAGGRPTKYKPEYCDIIVSYFIAEAEEDKLPFLSKFAREIAGVCCDTAIEWTKEYPEFSESYKKAKDIQKEYLISHALDGKINPTAFIFTAKNITDMRDRQETEHKFEGIEDILKAIHDKRNSNR